MTSRTTAASRSTGFAGHPRGLATLFFTELWERFSYYGMRALLVLYMTAPAAFGGLELTTPEAARIYGNYTMAVYLLAIPGGFIADALVGARRAVLVGGLMITAGHFCLAVPSVATFYSGLILIALGTGLFKPNISAMVGGLYPVGDGRRDAGFSIFYMGINIGAFIAPLITGFLAQSETFKAVLAARGFDPMLSWHWGFGAAGAGMLLAMISFAVRGGVPEGVGRIDSVAGDAARRTLLVMLGTAALLALSMLSDTPGFLWLRALFAIAPVAAIVYFARQTDLAPRRIGAAFVFFLAAMLFWAIFDQAALSIALFADQMTRNEMFGMPFPSAWYQALNPLFVIILAPLFAALWVRLGSRQPSTPAKFAIGLFCLGLSFLWMIPAAQLAAAGKVSPWWLVGLFFLQTLGEMCLSPVGLSAMTKLMPPERAGLMLGIWFLAAAWGSKLAGVLSSGFGSGEATELAWFFGQQAIVVLAATLILGALVPWIKSLMGEQR